VIPKYANAQISNMSPASHVTAQKVQVIRIKTKLSFYVRKKKS